MSADTKISLQQYADEVLAPEYRQPLKTAEEMCALHGWGDPNSPQCCGAPIEIRSMIGDPYYAECKTCRKFGAAMDGPRFGKSSVRFLDGDRIDLDTERRWIVGYSPDESMPAREVAERGQ